MLSACDRGLIRKEQGIYPCCEDAVCSQVSAMKWYGWRQWGSVNVFAQPIASVFHFMKSYYHSWYYTFMKMIFWHFIWLHFTNGEWSLMICVRCTPAPIDRQYKSASFLLLISYLFTCGNNKRRRRGWLHIELILWREQKCCYVPPCLERVDVEKRTFIQPISYRNLEELKHQKGRSGHWMSSKTKSSLDKQKCSIRLINKHIRQFYHPVQRRGRGSWQYVPTPLYTMSPMSNQSKLRSARMPFHPVWLFTFLWQNWAESWLDKIVIMVLQIWTWCTFRNDFIQIDIYQVYIIYSTC